MAITAAMVKELRERTGAGMMDCKKVLTEADGDLDKAIELRDRAIVECTYAAGLRISEIAGTSVGDVDLGA